MTKKDFYAALISGGAIGLFAAFIAKNLLQESGVDFAFSGWRIASIVVACFGLVCLLLAVAHYVSRKLAFAYEAAKFIIVGGLNTLVDFAALNLLIIIFNTPSGTLYSVFKGVSFILAVVNSYLWNKFWTFSSDEKTDTNKIIRFFTVSIVGFGINVIIASIIVNVIGAPGDFSQTLWANLGAFVATAISMIWNFVGYKFFVFHHKQERKGTLFASERR